MDEATLSSEGGEEAAIEDRKQNSERRAPARCG